MLRMDLKRKKQNDPRICCVKEKKLKGKYEPKGNIVILLSDKHNLMARRMLSYDKRNTGTNRYIYISSMAASSLQWQS